MIRRPPRSTLSSSSAASDVYKRQPLTFLQQLRLATLNSVCSLGFQNAHHKITPKGKSGRGPGLGELPNILESPLIFLQRLKPATSNLVHSLGLPKLIKNYTQRKKWAWPVLGELTKSLGFPFNISATAEASDLVCCFGLPRPIIKSHPEEKWAWFWDRGAPRNFGVPFNTVSYTHLTLPTKRIV